MSEISEEVAEFASGKLAEFVSGSALGLVLFSGNFSSALSA